MKKNAFLFSLVVVFIACKKQDPKQEIEQDFKEVTTVKTLNYQELQPLLKKNDDKTYVVNFWATWCAPCVKELPYFEKINQEYTSRGVEVLLVSLDFPKQVEKKLIPFINKKKLQSKIVFLDDVNEDFWIKDIHPSWSGAIPATLIYNKKNRKFYEQSFDYETLENELQAFLKP